MEEKTGILEDLRVRAAKMLEQSKTDPDMTEKRKKLIADIDQFLKKEDNLNKVHRGVVCRLFLILGYDVSVSELDVMYDKLMNEINGTYLYVDPKDLMH